jgi:hypothetical protein
MRREKIMKEFLKGKNIILASIAGSLLTLIALICVFLIAPSMASASTGQANATPTSTKTSPTTKVNYCNQYEQALATKLNVSVSTLTQDNKAALITVINQKVKDGKLKQARADILIKKINSSAGNICPRHGAHKQAISHAWLNKYAQNVTTLLAQGLHLNASQLTAQFKAGKNLSDIAKTQKVSTNALQTLVKNTANTIIKQAVSAGTLKQAQATRISAYIQKHPEAIQKLESEVVKKVSKK